MSGLTRRDFLMQAKECATIATLRAREARRELLRAGGGARCAEIDKALAHAISALDSAEMMLIHDTQETNKG